MRTCKHKKRLPMYLDGWLDESDAARFEKHLKKCSICQAELVEFEDVSSAALEIVDEAPENSYWDSFYSRTLNRIISRNISPYEKSGKPHKELQIKIGSYSLVMVSLAAILLIAVNFLPDILSLVGGRNVNREIAAQKVEPAPDAEINDRAESAYSDLAQRTGSESSENISNSASIAKSLSEPVASGIMEADIPGDTLQPGAEVMSYFKGDLEIKGQKLILSDLMDYRDRQKETEYYKINEDYRLSSSMIAAGILSEAGDNSRSTGSFDGRAGFPSSEYEKISFLTGSASGNWGYLSMPQDSGEADEFRRYLIELELIQAK